MAEYTIVVEGDELEELQAIVAAIHKEQPAAVVTENSYVQGLVQGHLAQRVREAYIAHAGSKTTAELKNLFGSRKEISRGK